MTSAKMMDMQSQWHSDVSTRLQESAVAHQNTAIILERMKGQMDAHDVRIRNLEGAPAEKRAATMTATAVWQVVIGVASVVMMAVACAGGGLVTYALSHLLK